MQLGALIPSSNAPSTTTPAHSLLRLCGIARVGRTPSRSLALPSATFPRHSLLLRVSPQIAACSFRHALSTIDLFARARRFRRGRSSSPAHPRLLRSLCRFLARAWAFRRTRRHRPSRFSWPPKTVARRARPRRPQRNRRTPMEAFRPAPPSQWFPLPSSPCEPFPNARKNVGLWRGATSGKSHALRMAPPPVSICRQDAPRRAVVLRLQLFDLLRVRTCAPARGGYPISPPYVPLLSWRQGPSLSRRTSSSFAPSLGPRFRSSSW